MKRTTFAFLAIVLSVLQYASSSLPPDAESVVDGASRKRHQQHFAKSIASWARRNGVTRDELCDVFLNVAESLKTSENYERRGIVISQLGIFGSTNALPILQEMATDVQEPNGGDALRAYYELVGFSPTTLGWAEEFLLNPQNNETERRREFLNAFRHSLSGDELPKFERESLCRTLYHVTESVDDLPTWTDEILCLTFPDYVGSVERRTRLENAQTRLPASISEKINISPEGWSNFSNLLENALASAPGTNATPFKIPVPRLLRSAPRTIPEEFVVPEVPERWQP